MKFNAIAALSGLMSTASSAEISYPIELITSDVECLDDMSYCQGGFCCVEGYEEDDVVEYDDGSWDFLSEIHSVSICYDKSFQSGKYRDADGTNFYFRCQSESENHASNIAMTSLVTLSLGILINMY